MPLYFFDVKASPLKRDTKGEEFATLSDAKDHVARTVKKLIEKGGDLIDAEVVVRDELGEVFRVRVGTEGRRIGKLPH